MSVRTLSRVWDGSTHSGTELLMMLAIADFSDDDGNAYPAVPTLAKKCRMSVRNANFLLTALKASGELEVRANEGPRGTNRYRVVVGLRVAPLKPTSSTPEAGFPIPLKPTSDEPSLNRQEPKKTRERPSPPTLPAIKLLPDVEPQTLLDWEVVRKARKAGQLTLTAVKGLRAEAKKAGLTMQQVIEICCLRNWASFKNAWDWSDAVADTRKRVLHSDDVFAGAR